MGGFPLGDLFHWWNPALRPGATDYYTSWKAQSANENSRIATWLATGKDPGTVSVKSQGGIPSKYELSQNYPNPFNPSTRIDYSIPVSGHVSLKVFNLLGEEVATIFTGNQKAGNYVADFNAQNLTSGVYFYRLQAGNVSITKKLVFTK
jgi:hypothetical protein